MDIAALANVLWPNTREAALATAIAAWTGERRRDEATGALRLSGRGRRRS